MRIRRVIEARERMSTNLEAIACPHLSQHLLSRFAANLPMMQVLASEKRLLFLAQTQESALATGRRHSLEKKGMTHEVECFLLGNHRSGPLLLFRK
jgi:hypothetical protein